jgi:integrase/recombinase XerD
VRIERAIDAFLGWLQLERDATDRTLDSYRRILNKLADDYPEARLSDFEGRSGTERLRVTLQRWANCSSATRCNVISVLHSFFGWAEAEDLVDVDPSRRIRRPPKRRPAVDRPSLLDLAKLRPAATLYERAPMLLLEGVGLRNSEVRSCRWQSIDLVNGRVQVFRKGKHWQWVPVAPDVLDELRRCFREIGPDLDDHVFTVEVEQWVSARERRRRRLDPKQPRSSQALGRMVKRVCERAGIHRYSPHPLRRGFGNRFLRESERDVYTLKGLYGHSSVITTEGYVEDMTLDEQAEALRRAVEHRNAQASPDLATPEREPSSSLETEEWRRRESNPRTRHSRNLRFAARFYSIRGRLDGRLGDKRPARAPVARTRKGRAVKG